MKKWLESYAAILKSLGAFALCFVMLFMLTGAVAEGGVDAQEDLTYKSSNNIADFCEVKIEPELPDPGEEIPKNTVYTFSMHPDEAWSGKRDPNMYFDLDYLQYQLPQSGVSFTIETPGQTLILEGRDVQGKPQYIRASVTIENGLLKVTWDKKTDSYKYLKETTNANFNLKIQMKADGSDDAIVTTGSSYWLVDNTASVTFTKEITPDHLKDEVAAELEKNSDAYSFSTTLHVAKKNADGSFVRDANHHIVYEEQNVNFTLADMRQDDGTYSITWNNLQPSNQPVVITENEPNDAFLEALGYQFVKTRYSIDGGAEVDSNNMQAQTGALEGFYSGTCSLDNVYEQVKGSLTINKSIIDGSSVLASNLSPDQRRQIIFEVTGTAMDGTTVVFDQQGTTKKIFTYEDMSSGSITLPDLPAGIYTVTEKAKITNNEWHTVTYKINNGEEKTESAGNTESSLDKVDMSVNVGAGNTTLDVSNGYERENGKLELRKVFGEDSVALSQDQIQSLKFFLTTEDNKYVWFGTKGESVYAGVSNNATERPSDLQNGFSATDDLKCIFTVAKMPGGKVYAATIGTLPVGKYKLYETYMDFAGYDRETWYGIGFGTDQWTKLEGEQACFEVEVTKNGGDYTYVYFKNTYHDDGSLKINKQVSGKTLTDQEKRQITFTIEYEKSPGNWVQIPNKSTYTYFEFTGDSLTLTNLPYGNYRVTENNAAMPNYSHTTEYTVTQYGTGTTQTTTEATGTQATVNVTNPYANTTQNGTVQPGQVSFTNTYSEIKKDLTISKTFAGSYLTNDADLKANTKFTLTDENGNQIRWKKVNDNYVYTTDTGADTSFEINYSDMVNGSFTLTGLPVGHTYTVQESDGGKEGYTHTTKVTVNNGTPSSTTADTPSGNVPLTQEGGNGSISFENRYTPVATLKVTKKFTGDLGNNYAIQHVQPNLRFYIYYKEGNQTVYLTKNGGESETPDTNCEFTYNDLSSNGLRVLGDVSREYYIREISADPNENLSSGFDITVTSSVLGTNQTGNEEIMVNVEPGADVTAEFTNDYQQKYQSGIVPGEHVGVVHHYKTWSGLDGGASNGAEYNEVKEKIQFKLYRKNANNQWELYDVYGHDELVGTGGNAKYITLPEGTYMLEELDADLNGYERLTTVTIKVNNESVEKDVDITDEGVDFDVPSKSTIQISLANVYHPMADLVLAKSLDPDGDLTSVNALGDNRRQNIVFTVKLGDVVIKTVKLSEFAEGGNQWTYTVKDLPIGEYYQDADGTWKIRYNTYTVVESGVVDGYTYTTTWTVGGTTSDGTTGSLQLIKKETETTAPAQITFTNKFTRQRGQLTVKKSFGTEGITKSDTRFEIYDSRNQLVKWNAETVNGKTTYVYAENDGNSSITYAQMADGSFTVTNLPTDTYTVKESNAGIDGYAHIAEYLVKVGSNNATKGNGTNAGVQVIAGAESQVEYNNTYTPKGKLTVRKTFSFVGESSMSDSEMKARVTFKLYEGEGKSKTYLREIPGRDCAIVNNQNNTYTMTCTFSDLDLGTYTVEEINHDNDDFTRVTTVTVNGQTTEAGETPTGKTEIKSAGAEVEIAFENRYTEVDQLEIIKAFQGIDDEFREKLNANKDKIVFAVRDSNNTLLPDNNGNYVVVNGERIGTFTYAQMDQAGKYNLTGIPVGSYTVTEIILGESNDITEFDNPFYGYIHTATGTNSATRGWLYYDHVNGENGLRNVELVEKVAGDDPWNWASFTNYYQKIPKLVVVKECEKAPLDDNNDLPTWQFTVKIQNAHDKNVLGDTIELNDTFNKLYPEDLILVTTGDKAPKITDGYTVSCTTDNAGHAKYEITLKKGHTQQNEITLTYHLQARDKNALIHLLDNGGKKDVITTTNPQTLKWTFTNTIEYHPMPNETATDIAEYYYTLAPVSKSMDYNGNTRLVTFTLDINPKGVQVGTASTLSILDKMSGDVEVDMSSFVVEPAGYRLQVEVEPYTESDDWDLKITVPNGVALRISYDALVVGKGMHPVSNTVEALQVTAKVEQNIEIKDESSGSYSLAVLYLNKIGRGYTDVLQGAEFELYEYAEGENQPSEDDLCDLVAVYTTDAAGEITIKELNKVNPADTQKEPNLRFNRWYKLVETKAPKGYELKEDPIFFYLPYVSNATPTKSSNYNICDPYDHIYVKNKPLVAGVALRAVKVLNGKALDDEVFTFQLLDGNRRLLQEKKNIGRDVTFDTISFTYNDLAIIDQTTGELTGYHESIERTYIIKEVIPADAVNNTKDGISYDPVEYTAKVTVALNEDNTALVANVVYAKGNETLAANQVPTFINEYEAEGSVTLEGVKKVENTNAVTKAFSFDIIKQGSDVRCTVQNETSTTASADINYPTFKFVVNPDAAAGVSCANGVITITAQSVDAIKGPHIFTISEKVDVTDSYAEDQTEYTYTINVIDNGNGQLTAVGTLNDGKTAADFTNTWDGKLIIRKVVEVGNAAPTESQYSLVNGTYTFAVYTDEACQNVAKTINGQELDNIQLVINGVQSAATTITGLAPGKYWVKEIGQLPQGMSVKDSNPVRIELNDTAAAADLTATITNNLGVGNLSIKKVVTGTDDTSRKFTFLVEVAGTAGKTYGNVTFDSQNKATIELTAGQTITIDGLPIGAAYTITEQNIPEGYAAGTITNDGTGTIVGGVTEVVQVNYAMEGEAELKVSKQVTGNEAPDETFTFYLMDSNGQQIDSKTCTAGGTATFDKQTYTSAGTYWYTIKEAEPANETPGMVYNTTAYYAKVVATHIGEGKLETVVTYGSTQETATADSLTITNTYVKPVGEAEIAVTKAITGDAYTGDKKFEFTLTPGHTQGDTNNKVTGEPSQSVAQNGTASWKVAYDKEGTYTYTIKETVPSVIDGIPGMTYDGTEYTVTVTVAYDPVEKDLDATVTYGENSNSLTVTNTYEQPKGEADIELTKAVTGNTETFNKDEAFTFTLTKDEETAPSSDTNNVVKATPEGVKVGDNFTGMAAWKIAYDQPGIYFYTIKETEGTTPGMAYDTTPYYVKVVMTYSKDGKTLVPAVSYGTSKDGMTDSLTITNKYSYAAFTPQIIKELTDLASDAPAETFSFTLTQKKVAEGATAYTDEASCLVAHTEGDGLTVLTAPAVFKEIVYHEAGTYEYEIVENKPNPLTPGMTYSEHTVKLEVKVDRDDATGELTVTSVTYTGGKVNEAAENQANIITNTYVRPKGKAEILVTKALTGNTYNGKNQFSFLLTKLEPAVLAADDLTDDGFGFPLVIENNSVAEDPKQTIGVGESAKWTVVYDQPGTYYYTIQEIVSDDDKEDGMEYDTKIYYVKVIVAYNGDLDQLVATVTYGTEAEEAADPSLTVTNKYSEISFTPEVKKVVEGENIPEGEVFHFTLTNETENGDDYADTASCEMGETATFKTITYNEPGTYTYLIKEEVPALNSTDPEAPKRTPGMTYSTEEITYQVVVERDAATGMLSITSETYTGGSVAEGDETGMANIITNTYARPKGDANVKVEKALTGNVDAYKANETFRFELKVDEHLLTSATNNVVDTRAMVIFPGAKVGESVTWRILYDQPGTYTYSIKELEGKTSGMAYDTEVHTVTVVVEYAEDLMSLVSTVIYENPVDEDDAEVMPDVLVITNQYSEISYQPKISKEVEGWGAPDETFYFTLTDGAGYTDHASCGDNEEAWFNVITYHEPGTYVYTITEDVPKRKTYGMHYSKEPVTLTVNVMRAEDGTLSLTAAITHQGIITNTYIPPEPGYDYKFSFTKKWQGGVEASLEWTLYDTNGNVVHKKFNKDIIDEREWYYEAWFATDKGYYIIEDVPEGYTPIYINVGKYEDVTDRLYNGGTIINYKVPQTSDGDSPAIWVSAMMCSAAVIMIRMLRRKRVQ